MKLFAKTHEPYLTKAQWRKVFLSISIMALVLYTVAMIFSLCGSDFLIMKYQNSQMDRIEAWFRNNDVLALISLLFMAFESCIILSFCLNRLPKWYEAPAFYLVNIALALVIKNSFQMAFTLTQIALCILFIILEMKKSCWKGFIKLLVGFAVGAGLQAMITVIKGGYFDGENHIMNLSAHFIYAIEYDIALSVILFTISLYINREKGEQQQWEMAHTLGGSSQTSKMKSQKQSLMKNLPKHQKNKIRLLYLKVWFIQMGAFLLVMVLPFLLGKVFEFLVMYVSFAIVRYILGFKYSLHFKKEATCVGVSVLIFGILTLVVPFFFVEIIIAILLGCGLAILLHLSYKYKGMWLFMEVANRDRFASLYVFFDGDLSEYHIKSICKMKGLEPNETDLIYDFMCRNKLSYLAFKYNYSERSICYKLDEYITKLLK